MTAATNKKRTIIYGWIISAIAILFLLFDSIGKLAKPDIVVKSTIELGYPQSCILGLGIILLISTILYAIPRSSFFGALFLTAYLGGAVATNVRVSAPLFSHTLFPIYFAIIIWVGLYLRSPLLRNLIKNKIQ